MLLGRRYGEVSFDSQDASWIHIPSFPLPPGWDRRQVAILIDIPWGTPGYPSVAPEWFWTEHDLRTKTGKKIGHFFVEAPIRDSDRDYLAAGWGHFCVHLQGPWRPSTNIANGHNLLSYANLIWSVLRNPPDLAVE
ncbi:E2/UBC family protein [Nonomuraea sp. NPDC026600]|uniref:E2/UBC family protein n=1 Tax=Nonomuraea sp. NPDC026600 TaxID=3155363 RepID=UPI0033E702EB